MGTGGEVEEGRVVESWELELQRSSRTYQHVAHDDVDDILVRINCGGGRSPLPKPIGRPWRSLRLLHHDGLSRDSQPAFSRTLTDTRGRTAVHGGDNSRIPKEAMDYQ
jgi:hypothetical protein